MKRFISSFFIITSMIFFCSCSSNSTTDTTAIDYTNLNSTWECDYLKISTSSEWTFHDSLLGESTFAFWSWNDGEQGHYIELSISRSSLYEKLTQSDAIAKWEETKALMMQDEDEGWKEYYQSRAVSDSFVKNGQAYILVTSELENEKSEIHFYANEIHGNFTFAPNDEELVIKMIETIEFYI